MTSVYFNTVLKQNNVNANTVRIDQYDWMATYA